jgi:cellulose synthase (UDP-forming)
MSNKNPSSSSRARQAIMLLGAIVCVAYLIYRALFSLNLTTPYAGSASIFLLVGESFGIVSLILYFIQVWDVSEPPEQTVLERRTVDVLVPTYKEDVHLLRTTLQACKRMDYAHETYLFDYGRRPEVEALAR